MAFESGCSPERNTKLARGRRLRFRILPMSDADESNSSGPAKKGGPVENAQFAMLNRLRKERMRVDVYLVTGTRLQGRIQSFDGRSMLLQTDAGELLLYHHAVSSVQQSETRGKGRASSRTGPPRQASERSRPAVRHPPPQDDEDPPHEPAPRPATPVPAPVVVTRRRSRLLVPPKE